mgnify:CR=1 FL=1
MYPSELAGSNYQVVAQQYAFPTVKLSYTYGGPINDLPVLRDSRAMRNFIFPVFEDFVEHYEEFHIILLNHGMRVLGHCPIGKGGLNSCVADARLVLQAAILSNASAVVLVHNHPSGALVPSNADRNLTRNLSQALQLVNIKVVDHIILTRDSYFSFADFGEPSLL